MLRCFTFSLFTFFLLANCLANATVVSKKSGDMVLNLPIQELLTSNIYQSSQSVTPSLSTNQSESWIKETLGDDFHHFYVHKVKNKKQKINKLKMDFHLASLNNPKAKAQKIRKVPAEINETQIETLVVPKVEFSEEIYEWNAANISIVGLGNDYQQFVNDEILAGQTYKEFWDGEETTEFEDFIDDHFSFHDSALFRVLLMLAGSLVALIGYKLLLELMQYIDPD